MNVAEYKARRAAMVEPRHREICPQCRKAVPTCYCHALRPFVAPASFVILQHYEEARNAIATARMAHLSIRNSEIIVGRSFAGHPRVDALIAAPERRNVMLYPSPDAMPIEALLEDGARDPRPLAFWVLDAKWAQVPKMLRLSPNVRAIPMVRFTPDRASFFQIRKQPHPSYLSTIESIFLVIERLQRAQASSSTAHHALIDVFRYLVEQQLAFVDVDRDVRHRAAKALRRSRKLQKIQQSCG